MHVCIYESLVNKCYKCDNHVFVKKTTYINLIYFSIFVLLYLFVLSFIVN